MRKEIFAGVAIALAIAVSACGSTQVNRDQVVDARAALRGAEEVGATSHPDAALHVQLAREQIAKAEKLIEEGEGEDANMLLERAKVDAELAIELARAERVRKEAREAKERVDELQRRDI